MYDLGSIYQARTIEDAIRALRERPGSKLINGGTDVLVQVREGRLAGVSLVSIHNLEELKGVSLEADETIVIGSGTTFSQITGNPIIQKYIPMLGEAVDQVGGPQIRNVGTIGGNVCNGVTSADSGSTLMVYNAVMTVQGLEGIRHISIHDWYAGPGRTVLKPDEVLLNIQIRKEDYEGYTGQYLKYGKRQAMEIATLGCGVLVKLSADKEKAGDIRIAFGVAGPNPLRCRQTEEACRQRPVNQETALLISEQVLREIKPRDSWRASKEFREQIASEYAKRAFIQAVAKQGGEIDA